MSNLALLGGKAVRTRPYPDYNTIGKEEKDAVMQVMDSGILSGYLGAWSPEFYGGPWVQKLERQWEKYYDIAYAVSVNSATTALTIAVGALDIGPGDEVIVSPFTMTASVSCVLMFNAIPVFADISPDTFCLSPDSIREKITDRTKAIIVVDLFGHPFEADAIMSIAKEFNLKVIEDAAQAYGAKHNGRPAGTLADIGVYSLNVHKTINCGEGGICVTEDENLAEKMQLIRNHGEEVVKLKGVKNIVNVVGQNYRMCEIEAAISSEQLKKIDELVSSRIKNAEYLTARLKDFPGIIPPIVKEGITHGYYGYPIRYDKEMVGISIDLFVKALTAEGVMIGTGYVEPIYLQPLFQKQIAYGEKGCPFTCGYYTGGKLNYAEGTCPVAERMHNEEWMGLQPIHQGVSLRDLDDIILSFEKIFDNIEKLRNLK